MQKQSQKPSHFETESDAKNDATRSKQTAKIAWLSLVGNTFLAVVKIFLGMLSSSSAMLADGLNSAGDCGSSIAMLIGNHLSSQPKDEDHPYGHGKAEYIFSAAIGLALILVAWQTAMASVRSLFSPKSIEKWWLLLLLCVVNILLKLFLYRYSTQNGKKYKNPLILAIAQDHRSDVFVTAGTALGIIGMKLGFPYLDGMVGLAISLIIAKNALDILKDAYHVLMDTTEKESSPLVKKALDIIYAIPEIDHIDAINASPVGARFLVVIKISVPGDMTVTKSHQLTRLIKDPLMQEPDVAEVLIHVNPMEKHIGPSQL